MQVSAQAVHNPAEIEAVLDAQASALNGGVIVLASPLVETDRKQIIALAAKDRLPAIYHFREYVEDGGLASYGAVGVKPRSRTMTHLDDLEDHTWIGRWAAPTTGHRRHRWP
jgi:putative ABC transport system substrate-binding protein